MLGLWTSANEGAKFWLQVLIGSGLVGFLSSAAANGAREALRALNLESALGSPVLGLTLTLKAEGRGIGGPSPACTKSSEGKRGNRVRGRQPLALEREVRR
jgi:hypothetical protein